MTTLISVHNSEGEVGRCDAKCHNAKHKDCDCCCGGVNHGVGGRQAIQNTREMANGLAENAGLAFNIDILNQMELPGLEGF